MTGVGNILLYFDSDKLVPLFGFGGVIWGTGFDVTSHCFAMNGNMFWPECVGIEGMVNSYKNCIFKVGLSGPTYFAPLLQHINKIVTYCSEEFPMKYFTILIITDGEIHDMAETIDEIVISSTLPVSIIIVGVGNANFKAMHELDADDGPLFSPKHQKH